MKKIAMLSVMALILSGCLLQGKKVTVHDTKRDINYVITEDGVMVEGEIDFKNGTTIKIEEHSE